VTLLEAIEKQKILNLMRKFIIFFSDFFFLNESPFKSILCVFLANLSVITLACVGSTIK